MRVEGTLYAWGLTLTLIGTLYAWGRRAHGRLGLPEGVAEHEDAVPSPVCLNREGATCGGIPIKAVICGGGLMTYYHIWTYNPRFYSLDQGGHLWRRTHCSHPTIHQAPTCND